MKIRILSLCWAFLFATAATATAASLAIEIFGANPEGQGARLGTVTAEETTYGTLFVPNLAGLPPGLHGFHVHAMASCAPGEKDGHKMAGLAAGGHFDPSGSNAHRGPYGDGHLGDLPAIYVDGTGAATHPVLAPRLRLSDLHGHSLMIHEGGDNYADVPKPLGGGGARVACGVVP
jgi:Cu-Zn family superoxide dismutase